MPHSRNNFYKIATVIFLTLSVIFGSILVRQQQDIRNKAQVQTCSQQGGTCGSCSSPPNGWSDATNGPDSFCGCVGPNGNHYWNSTCNIPSGGNTPPSTGSGNCGTVPNGGVAYDQNSRCNYTCNNGTWSQAIAGSCLPAGQSPQVAPTGTYLTNGATGQIIAPPGGWTSNGTTVSVTSSNTGPFANRTETCQVCTCTSLTNGECRSNCTMMPCSQAQTPSCGQVDLCPAGQPPTQCGAAAENRVVGTNCTNNVSTPTPTNTPTPTRIPTNTPTPTRIPTNTPTPTRIPTNTPTPAPRSCGSVNCSNTSNPCQNGLVCITANDSINYCAKPDYVQSCRENPGSATCCNPPAPTVTPTNPPPQPRACGAIDCGNTYNPCENGLVCVAAKNSKNYCAKPDYIQACKDQPNSATCCSAPNVTNTPTPAPNKPKGPTPTRIILPVSGVDLPLKSVGIVGGIVTLLGILLIL